MRGQGNTCWWCVDQETRFVPYDETAGLVRGRKRRWSCRGRMPDTVTTLPCYRPATLAGDRRHWFRLVSNIQLISRCFATTQGGDGLVAARHLGELISTHPRGRSPIGAICSAVWLRCDSLRAKGAPSSRGTCRRRRAVLTPIKHHAWPPLAPSPRIGSNHAVSFPGFPFIPFSQPGKKDLYLALTKQCENMRIPLLNSPESFEQAIGGMDVVLDAVFGAFYL